MPHPRPLILPIIATLLLLARHIVQETVFLGDPIRLVQFGGVDEALLFAVGAEQEDAGERPVHGPGPVGEEDEEADGEDVVAGDAVVGVGEVDGGDGVAVAEGEEGGLG